MDIDTLFVLGTRVGGKLVARDETIAVAESSAGGLISAALLARAGASTYYFRGAVLYTRRSHRLLTTLTSDDTIGMRSSSLPYAPLLVRHQRGRFRAKYRRSRAAAFGRSARQRKCRTPIVPRPAAHLSAGKCASPIRQSPWRVS